MRGLILKALATAGMVMAGALTLGSSPALAAHYGLVGSFGSLSSTPSDPEPLSRPAGVAVSRSTEDVYVVDQGNDRVERFNRAGEYLSQFDGSATPAGAFSFSKELDGSIAGLGNEVALNGLAVDNSTTAGDPSKGDLYVVDLGHIVIDKFSATGAYEGQLTGTTSGPFAGIGGVAVDTQGNVWVVERTGHRVDEFDDEGHFVEGGGFSEAYEHAHGIAVDASGNLYVARGPVGERDIERWVKKEGVWENGKEEGTAFPPTEPPSTAIALDPTTGNLYVNEFFGESTTVESAYNPLGEQISLFGEGVITSGSGIAAASSASGSVVYVADAASDDIDVFAPGEPPEKPLIEPAEVEQSKAALASGRLHGQVNPGEGGGEVGYHFAYNATGNCTATGGKTTLPGKAVGNKVSVEATVSKLLPGTQYKICLVAEANAFGNAVESEEILCAVPPAVTGLTSCTAETTGEEAILEASLEPKGAPPAKYYFQYGTDLSYGFETEAMSSESAGAVAAEDAVDGLEPNQTYDCRLVATREIEGTQYTTYGANGTFHTSAVKPVVGEAWGSSVGSTWAVVDASISPQNSPTTYYIECVEAARYHPKVLVDPYSEGVRTPAAGGIEVGSDIAYHTLERTLEGLAPGAVYHFRVVATNELGTVYGEDETFSTAPVIEAFASGVTQTGAVLSGMVDPEGSEMNWVFEYGVTSEYGAHISGQLPANAQPETISVTLGALAPNTTFHFRLVVRNAKGPSYGPDQTFVTQPGVPPEPVTLAPYSLIPPAAPLQLAIPPIVFPTEAGVITNPGKGLTRGQKLARALRACRGKPKRARVGCERQAYSRFGRPGKRTARTHR